ncbi:MAG: RNA polymerase sigma-70 factor [Candidatus Pseudobacter hemicellulosilyticus]|uniref:RNA polymerase sigma-70 factor n=1 Tax=Candidatus Pseudobacter hemicellulosilyticus TaxID=3121375 RepID=A0AAJ6BJ60_9BACT|nr:MAG: RNA polymerase sigma-70 factor [Pseudobacter sp.]
MTAPVTHTEKQLLAESAGGSQPAFAELFHLYKDKLYSYLLRLTASPELTEDIVQEVFLTLWANRDTLVQVEHFNAYLFRMARNRVINAFRRMAKETLILATLNRPAPETGTEAEEKLAAAEVQARLKAALDRLPPRQKQVFLLSRQDGLRHDEIARILSIAPSTVNNHLIEALRFIRQELGQYLHTAAGAWCILSVIAAIEK